jgi:hypothetical protein
MTPTRSETNARVKLATPVQSAGAFIVLVCGRRSLRFWTVRVGEAVGGWDRFGADPRADAGGGHRSETDLGSAGREPGRRAFGRGGHRAARDRMWRPTTTRRCPSPSRCSLGCRPHPWWGRVLVFVEFSGFAAPVALVQGPVNAAWRRSEIALPGLMRREFMASYRRGGAS